MIAVGYCHPDKVDAHFVTSLWPIIKDERVTHVIPVWWSPKLDEGRNYVFSLWRETDAEYLLMVDSDMVLPPNTLERLLRAGREIVSGLAFIGNNQRGNVRPSLLIEKEGRLEPWWDYPRMRLVRVDAVGASCLLVHRSVLEKVPEPWFTYEHGGEDVSFCRKAASHGFDIWCDTGLVVPHMKPRPITEADYRRRK